MGKHFTVLIATEDGRRWTTAIRDELPHPLVVFEGWDQAPGVPAILGVWSVPQQQILVHPVVAWWSSAQRDGALLAELSRLISRNVSSWSIGPRPGTDRLVVGPGDPPPAKP